jgi:hypothetical protein
MIKTKILKSKDWQQKYKKNLIHHTSFINILY